ncbi:AraC family transcriptional regulator [Saccharopolyspora indica]|uniref:helix-turn-helix domain-containing protein n=1 Tax=Saccharopolyspora indica TaxID=1229659 RepID=UPI0022EAF7F1|nr:AraC family transcriptional regulator [Saccharopolyspora indica]MDA3646123.1 AraC family transcriptional regulator [Saccharopolyspora indica]
MSEATGTGVRSPEFWHDPRFPQVESRRSCRQNSCYRPHTHDRFAVGLIDEGTSAFVGRSGSPVRLEPRDVVLIPAGHVHSCNPVGGDWVYQMMLFDPEWLRVRAWAHDAAFDGAIQVHRDSGVYRLFDDVNAALFEGARDLHGLERLLRRAFAGLGAASVRREDAAGGSALAETLRPVLDVLAEQSEDPRLDDLATAVGMSRYQLIRAVKRATGLTPIAWRNNARVMRARAMLRGGEPITSVAHALGFADQSHFHRVFRAHVATTPGAYVR